MRWRLSGLLQARWPALQWPVSIIVEWINRRVGHRADRYYYEGTKHCGIVGWISDSASTDYCHLCACTANLLWSSAIAVQRRSRTPVTYLLKDLAGSGLKTKNLGAAGSRRFGSAAGRQGFYENRHPDHGRAGPHHGLYRGDYPGQAQGYRRAYIALPIPRLTENVQFSGYK